MKINICVLAALALVFLLCDDLSAVQTTTEKFSAKEINNHTAAISDFLFGPVAKITGVLGGAYGLLSAVLTSSIRPLVTFGGIGLGVSVVPKFIESVFTLMLP